MDIYRMESLELLFHKVSRLHQNTLHNMLSGKEVYPGQPPLLRELAHRGGQSQKELAERLQIAPATLTVMLGRMEKTGLIERRSDPADQRISRVYLTDKGKAIHAEMREVMKAMEAVCFDRFTTEEKIILRRLLLQMYENLKRLDGPGPAPLEQGD